MRMVYVEECMHDTAIDDEDVWNTLSDLTHDVEAEHSVSRRMGIRQKRLSVFTDYLVRLETDVLAGSPLLTELWVCPDIARSVTDEVGLALERTQRNYS